MPFYLSSPYGAARVYGYWLMRNYREAHGLSAVNGDSVQPRVPAARGRHSWTRRIARGGGADQAGARKLGGTAPKYGGMWRMLQTNAAQS